VSGKLPELFGKLTVAYPVSIFQLLWKHMSVAVFTRSSDQPLSDYLISIERIPGAIKDMTSRELAAPCGNPNAVMSVKSGRLLRGIGHVIKMWHARSAYRI